MLIKPGRYIVHLESSQHTVAASVRTHRARHLSGLVMVLAVRFDNQSGRILGPDCFGDVHWSYDSGRDHILLRVLHGTYKIPSEALRRADSLLEIFSDGVTKLTLS
jgi:hypothetical protein